MAVTLIEPSLQLVSIRDAKSTPVEYATNMPDNEISSASCCRQSGDFGGLGQLKAELLTDCRHCRASSQAQPAIVAY